MVDSSTGAVRRVGHGPLDGGRSAVVREPDRYVAPFPLVLNGGLGVAVPEGSCRFWSLLNRPWRAWFLPPFLPVSKNECFRAPVTIKGNTKLGQLAQGQHHYMVGGGGGGRTRCIVVSATVRLGGVGITGGVGI